MPWTREERRQHCIPCCQRRKRMWEQPWWVRHMSMMSLGWEDYHAHLNAHMYTVWYCVNGIKIYLTSLSLGETNQAFSQRHTGFINDDVVVPHDHTSDIRLSLISSLVFSCRPRCTYGPWCRWWPSLDGCHQYVHWTRLLVFKLFIHYIPCHIHCSSHCTPD